MATVSFVHSNDDIEILQPPTIKDGWSTIKNTQEYAYLKHYLSTHEELPKGLEGLVSFIEDLDRKVVPHKKAVHKREANLGSLAKEAVETFSPDGILGSLSKKFKKATQALMNA